MRGECGYVSTHRVFLQKEPQVLLLGARQGADCALHLRRCLKWEPQDFPGDPIAETHAPNAGGLGLILGQGTIPHMLQLRVHMPQLKILPIVTERFHVPLQTEDLHATTKTQCSQISK